MLLLLREVAFYYSAFNDSGKNDHYLIACTVVLPCSDDVGFLEYSDMVMNVHDDDDDHK